MTRTEVVYKVARDFVCLTVGAVGIAHQEYTGRPLPALLAVYTALLGIPGAAALLGLLRRPTPTDGLPSQPAPGESQSGLPPSSTKS